MCKCVCVNVHMHDIRAYVRYLFVCLSICLFIFGLNFFFGLLFLLLLCFFKFCPFWWLFFFWELNVVQTIECSMDAVPVGENMFGI